MVYTLGESAFQGCFRLKNVTFGRGVIQIGINCFANCDMIDTITCIRDAPISFNYPAFSDNTLMNATLNVPRGTKIFYESVDPWRNFWNIYDPSETSALTEINENHKISWDYNKSAITFKNPMETKISIVDINGNLVYSGTEIEVLVPYKSFYIVCYGKQKLKVCFTSN